MSEQFDKEAANDNAICQRRTTFKPLRIAEHLNSANAPMINMLHGLAARYTQAWGDPPGAPTAALKQLWLLAYREAQVQAFADAYLAIAVCFALSVLMVPLLRKITPPAAK